MSHCTFSDVRAICDTDMTDAEITDLIVGISALQDLVLDGGGPSVIVRREVCRLWTAIRCFLKDPESEGLGEYRGDRSVSILKLNQHLKDMIKIAMGGITFRASYEPI